MKRHGKPVVFRVMPGQVFREHHAFYISGNGVWLTDIVPATYLEPATVEPDAV